MASWDPALIVRLCATGDSWSVSTNNADLVGWVDFLRLSGRALGPLAAFAAATLLGKECRDPGVVDEVAGASKSGSEDQVEEDTAERMLLAFGLLISCGGIKLTSAGRRC